MTTARKKLTLSDNAEYVISYISLGHMTHSCLGVSVKIDGEYYLINTVGIMQVNPYTQAKHDEYHVRQYKVVDEPIHPKKDKVVVYAKHYAIETVHATDLLNFIKRKKGQDANFDSFNHNCHNFVLAFLENQGFHDAQLHDHRLPCNSKELKAELNMATLGPAQTTALPVNNSCSSFRKQTAIEGEQNEIKTWRWNSMKIENEMSYVINPSYTKIILATPGITKKDSDENRKLKQAVYLLRDYAEGSFFWHPCRTYRTLVNGFINDMGKDNTIDTVDKLVKALRKKIAEYHRNNDIANAKGSLHQRLAFIDFVLNNPNFDPKILTLEKPSFVKEYSMMASFQR